MVDSLCNLNGHNCCPYYFQRIYLKPTIIKYVSLDAFEKETGFVLTLCPIGNSHNKNIGFAILNGKTLSIRKNRNNFIILNYIAIFNIVVTRNYNLALRCLKLSLNLNSIFTIRLLAYFYKCVKQNFTLVKNYLLRGIEQNDAQSMFLLARYYLECDVNNVLFEKYIHMAIDGKHVDAMCVYAEFCHDKNDFDKMEKYYEMASEFKHPLALYNLGIYYKNSDIDLAKHYFLQSIAFNHLNSVVCNIDSAYEKITHITTNLELYTLFATIKKPNEFIKSKITELKNTTVVNHYLNKMRVSEKYNIVEECVICYETRLNIMFNCGHLCCSTCYVKIDCCPICRKKFL